MVKRSVILQTAVKIAVENEIHGWDGTSVQVHYP